MSAPDQQPSAPHASHRFVSHARTFAGLTLVSRVLGLVRDALIGRIFGVSGLGSAFNIAFGFPNTFRRLFGEGALSAAFIPEYAQLIKHEPALANRFASLTVGLLSVTLAALVLLLEIVLVLVLTLMTLPEQGRAALLFLAVMLPYMPLICVTALLGGMLQTHGRFAAQAGAPVILNLCMIVAAAVSAHALHLSPDRTALLISGSVTTAGFLQLAWCLRDLRHHAAWSRAFHGARDSTIRMFRRMGPVAVGLGTLQIATLIEQWLLTGWPLYVGPTILGHPYPLDEGAAAALYNAQRLYQFPLGIFGIALATAVFPLLARQADSPRDFVGTLRRSLRLSLFIGLPATLGLLWVASDLTSVVYLGGRIDELGAERMARALRFYVPLVGAYSLTHVLTRAFYAAGDTKLPTRISIVTVILGLLLSTALMWPMSEAGLALGSSIAAAIQVTALLIASQKRFGAPDHRTLDATTLGAIARLTLSSLLMLGALALIAFFWPARNGPPTWTSHAVRLTADCIVGLLSFAAAAAVLCRAEIHSLLDRAHPPAASAAPVPPDPGAESK